MAQNITLLGASYSDVPGVKLPKTGGGQALFTDVSGTTATAADVASGKRFYLADGSEATGTSSGGGGDSGMLGFMGDNVELVSTFWNETVKLEDTDFATWTPSTTQKQLRASQTGNAISINLTNHDYVMLWRVQFTAAYLPRATLKNQIAQNGMEFVTFIYRYPDSVSELASGTISGLNSIYTQVSTGISSYSDNWGYVIFYNGSGNMSAATSSRSTVTNGFYATGNTSAGISSTVTLTPTITPKCPILYAKCDSSRFSTARAAEIDQTNSKFRIVGKLYRCQWSRLSKNALRMADMYNNPI